MSLQLQRTTHAVNVHSAPVAPQQQVKVVAPIATTTEVVCTQQQSLQLAMVHLNCSISELCFTRRIFPVTCFDEKTLEATGQPMSYEKYTNQCANYHASNDKIGTEFTAHCLRRGVKQGPDTLLDWIELGAFPLLEHRCLRAIVIRILETPDRSNRVLEEHAFAVDYDQADFNGAHGWGREDSHVTIQKVQEQLRDSIRYFLKTTSRCAELPNARFLTMIIEHVLPGDERPIGFREAHMGPIFFPCDDDWERVTIEQNAMIETSYQRMAMQSTFLQHASRPCDNQIPLGLSYEPFDPRRSRQQAAVSYPDWLYPSQEGSEVESYQALVPSSQFRKEKLMRNHFQNMMQGLPQGSQSTMRADSMGSHIQRTPFPLSQDTARQGQSHPLRNQATHSSQSPQSVSNPQSPSVGIALNGDSTGAPASTITRAWTNEDLAPPAPIASATSILGPVPVARGLSLASYEAARLRMNRSLSSQTFGLGQTT